MSVTSLTQAPRARRVRTVLARTLADAAGLHGTERELFALLVRLSYRPGPVARRRAWLAEHLGVTPRTVERAVGSLARRELVAVVHGTGRTPSAYTIDLPALVTRLTPPVQPAEPTPADYIEGRQNVAPGATECRPSSDKMSPQGRQNVASLRARDARDARELPDSYQYPLTPSPSDGRPAASTAGGKPPGTPPRCPHGRTERQGCRTCGTDTRTFARQAARQSAEQERAAAQARARARAAEQGTPRPAHFRSLIEQARKDATP